MYVAEVYVVGDDFAFLFVKYCLGFLFVLFVPVVVLLLEADIRVGIRSGQTSTVPYEQKSSSFFLFRTVFGSAVLCLQDLEGDGAEAGKEAAGGIAANEQVHSLLYSTI